VFYDRYSPDKILAHGRVELIDHSSASAAKADVFNITSRLKRIYQEIAASNVSTVTVLEIEDISGTVLCHYELTLFQTSKWINANLLVLPNTAVFNNCQIHVHSKLLTSVCQLII